MYFIQTAFSLSLIEIKMNNLHTHGNEKIKKFFIYIYIEKKKRPIISRILCVFAISILVLMCSTTYEPIETIYFYYRCDGSRFMWSRVIGPNNYVFWFFLRVMLHSQPHIEIHTLVRIRGSNGETSLNSMRRLSCAVFIAYSHWKIL